MIARLTEARCAVRSYSGDYTAHAHDHAQLMVALQGRMELQVAGRAAFADSSCGVVIPAGLSHGFMAPPSVRMLVVDVPDQAGVDRMRRFAVTPECGSALTPDDAVRTLAAMLAAPRILARRGLDLARLDAALAHALHEPWDTARMAALFCLSRRRAAPRRLRTRSAGGTGTPVSGAHTQPAALARAAAGAHRLHAAGLPARGPMGPSAYLPAGIQAGSGLPGRSQVARQLNPASAGTMRA
jgi:hypothetical protein